jgi:hypothetical protein
MIIGYEDAARSTLFIDHAPQCLVDERDGLRADRQGTPFLRIVSLYDMSVRRFKLFYEREPS